MDRWRSEAEEMVKSQLIPRGIKSPEVLEAMSNVPRHRFVPPSQRFLAYGDMALPLTDGQTISQPYMVARMTELLDVKRGYKVLEIGTGSGYQAAILAEMGADIVSVERIEALAVKADRLLRELGYNVEVITGDGKKGYSASAPYDRIIVTAAADSVEPEWESQLASGGRIILPLKVGGGVERLMARQKTSSGTISESWYDYCHFVPVVGGVKRSDKKEERGPE